MKTFLDGNVLISAFRGVGSLRERALQILADPGLELLVSSYIRLEILPKPVHFKNARELEFMRGYFDSTQARLVDSPHPDSAFELAAKYGLAALDALHLKAAIEFGADQFVTTERPTSPLCKVVEIKVLSLHELA